MAVPSQTPALPLSSKSPARAEHNTQGWVGYFVLSRTKHVEMSFPFGCSADPINFAFGEVLCKDWECNLRLLRLLLCAVGKGKNWLVQTKREWTMWCSPHTPAPLSCSLLLPVIFVSISPVWVFSCLISKMKNKWQERVSSRGIGAAAREVPSCSSQVLLTDLTPALFALKGQGRFAITHVPLAPSFDGQLLKIFHIYIWLLY